MSSLRKDVRYFGTHLNLAALEEFGILAWSAHHSGRWPSGYSSRLFVMGNLWGFSERPRRNVVPAS